MSEKLQFELGRPVEVIATEINTIKAQTQTLLLQASAEIGKRLIEAKEQVQHGEWTEWLKENVEYSHTTANNLMAVYREYGTNSQAFGNLTYSNAVALLGIAPEEREEFAKEVSAEELSQRELKKMVEEKKQLEKEKRELEEQRKREQLEHQQSLEQFQLRLEDFQEKAEQAQTVISENNELAQKLAVAESNVEQLQKDLKAKPIEATAVEVVPDEVQKELDQLRKLASESTDPAVVKFKLRFQSLVDEFRESIITVDEIADNQTKQQYKTAMHKLLDKMRAELEAGE